MSGNAYHREGGCLGKGGLTRLPPCWMERVLNREVTIRLLEPDLEGSMGISTSVLGARKPQKRSV